MLKLMGLCVIFLAVELLYESYVEKNECSFEKAENLILFAELLCVNVTELKMPLEVAVSSLKFRISPFMDEFTENFLRACRKNPNQSVRELFLKEFSEIKADKKIKREISRFLSAIGSSDKETTINYKNAAVKACEGYLSECRKKFEGKKKSVGAVATGASIVLAIFLI